MLRCFTVQVVAWAPVVWATSPGTAKASKSGWDFLCSFLDFAWYLYFKGKLQGEGGLKGHLGPKVLLILFETRFKGRPGELRRKQCDHGIIRTSGSSSNCRRLWQREDLLSLLLQNMMYLHHLQRTTAINCSTTQIPELWWNIKPFCTPKPQALVFKKVQPFLGRRSRHLWWMARGAPWRRHGGASCTPCAGREGPSFNMTCPTKTRDETCCSSWFFGAPQKWVVENTVPVRVRIDVEVDVSFEGAIGEWFPVEECNF